MKKQVACPDDQWAALAGLGPRLLELQSSPSAPGHARAVAPGEHLAQRG